MFVILAWYQYLIIISFKSLVNDFVYSFGRATLLLLVEV